MMDTFASSTTKLKEDHAAEVKKMADKFVADMKKLTDTYDERVKALETSVAEEKKAAEALAAKFKVDLGAAMSPAQALDVWLPLLTDLRRPADADPALATATKVLSTAPSDSEDAAKAHTVAGLAHFLKGDMAKAREQFLMAQASRAYRAGAGQGWARAADVGLQSINDPLAPLRRPVEPRKTDARVAARFLDTGVKAYKAGRYAEAATALAESAKADPSNPLAWYFLGAAKWETVGAGGGPEGIRTGCGARTALTDPSASHRQFALANPGRGPRRADRPRGREPAYSSTSNTSTWPASVPQTPASPSVVAITLVSPPAFQSYSRTTSQVSVDQRRIALVPSTVARS